MFSQELRCRVVVSTLPPQLLAHSVSLSPAPDANTMNIMRQRGYFAQKSEEK